MNIQTLLASIACAFGILAVSAQPADASQVLYDNSGFLQGRQSFQQSFDVAGPSLITVTLSNFDWPQPLSNLNLVVSTSQGLLGQEMGPGTETFKFGGGELYVQWFGSAQGPLNMGVYGLNIQCMSTVPLPASVLLLLSGLGLLAWQRRERAVAHS